MRKVGLISLDKGLGNTASKKRRSETVVDPASDLTGPRIEGRPTVPIAMC